MKAGDTIKVKSGHRLAGREGVVKQILSGVISAQDSDGKTFWVKTGFAKTIAKADAQKVEQTWEIWLFDSKGRYSHDSGKTVSAKTEKTALKRVPKIIGADVKFELFPA